MNACFFTYRLHAFQENDINYNYIYLALTNEKYE